MSNNKNTIDYFTNMYQDSKKQWSPFVGCKFDCVYCRKSFKAQMKRQKPRIDKNGKKRGCQQCYDYEPHFHKERLRQQLPRTKGDEFIWACSSADISFAKEEWIEQILEIIKKKEDRTFFFQTKDPVCFKKYDFPENVLLGITLETNYDCEYDKISKAPLPSKRYEAFLKIPCERKIVTIEPILNFNFILFGKIIEKIAPERVYIGYDTKNNNLPEPDLQKTLNFCYTLSMFTKVKTKFMEKVKK